MGRGGDDDQAERSADRRVFLEVRDPAALMEDLDSGRGLFVPTRLPLALNSLFVLGVRLRNVSRTLDLPMLVVGRRVPRGGSLLSAGVIAKIADPMSPMLAILREVAAGRLVDLESRLQEQVRVAVKSSFASTAEAVVELRALLEDDNTLFPVDRLVQRGDRLALAVTSDEQGLLVTPHVLVKSVHNIDGRRGCHAALLDDAGRTLVEQFLVRAAHRTARA